MPDSIPTSSLHVVPNINSDIGGPAVSVTRLCDHLCASSQRVILATLDYPEHGELVRPLQATLHSVQRNPLTKPLRGWSPSLRSFISEASRNHPILHNHGIWMFPNHYAAQASRAGSIPMVTSPRGMLGPWALSRHSLLKTLLRQLREQRDLETATAFHATSPQEAEDIRRAGFKQPIAVIPNGVEIPALTDLPDRPFLEALFPMIKNQRILLFMARLHPKKGLDMLLDAWGRLDADTLQSWQLVLAGPDLDGYGEILQKRIASNPGRGHILLPGSVQGAVKSAFLHHADLFILPTREENFGIAIAEALAHGTPAITTHGAPWKSLEEQHCGWWIPPTSDAVFHALRAAMSLTPTELQPIGEQARHHARTHFDWRRIAEDMQFFYHWILLGGETPAFVRTD